MREIILKNETLSSNQYDADNSKGAYCHYSMNKWYSVTQQPSKGPRLQAGYCHRKQGRGSYYFPMKKMEIKHQKFSNDCIYFINKRCKHAPNWKNLKKQVSHCSDLHKWLFFTYNKSNFMSLLFS